VTGHHAGIDPFDADQSLPACFARTVTLHGLRTALVSDTWRPTYRGLDETANRFAHELLRRGGAPGDRVAILMRHDTPLIAAMLSVLKAGRIVVVLNPTDPPARLKQLLEDAEPGSILFDGTHRDLATEVAGASCGIVCCEPQAAQGPTHDPGLAIDPDATAFLVYTSGSTGRPKGVLQTHRQIRQNAIKHSRAIRVGPEDRIALFASLSGSQGVGTSWSALSNGACLCPFPTIEKGVTGLAGWLADLGITVYVSSASLFRSFMKTLGDGARFPRVRVVRVGSEIATSDDFEAFRRHFPETCAFVHTLSSSETGNIAQAHLSGCDTVAAGRLAVGHAAEGMQVLLLDERDREVGPGQVGEIVVRSRYLSAGYWRNPALTAERFTECADGNRTFRSGDLGRMHPDGTLEFVGRRDARVKIRGFRVELSAVEEALLRLPEVESAAVCAIDRPSGELQLVAHVVLRGDQSATARTLRRALRPLLPDHMVPSAFVFLRSLPLTSHGKLDREKLRQSQPARHESRPGAAPRTETERLVAEIWAEVFNLAEIGRHDEFFDLGGDSLVAAVVAARIHDALGVELSLAAFAEHPTLSDLARSIDEDRLPELVRDASPLVRVSRDTALPLSLFQERTWRFSQTPQASADYTNSRSYRLVGPLDAEVLRECMSYLGRRHEILRTSFSLVDGQAVQIIHPPAPVPLPFLDLAGLPDAEERAIHFFRQEAAHVFDLGRLPLVRFSLVRIRENEHWLLRVHHFIIADGWSWRVYMLELARLYEARLCGEDPPLPEVAPLQYADYAAWQRQALHRGGAFHDRTVAWWKDLLSDAPPPLELPFVRSSPRARVAPADGVIRWRLDHRVWQRLGELGRGEGATYFMVRLAAFVALVAFETGEPDVVLGTYASNRNRVAVQDMLGLVTNLVTLRFRCEADVPFRVWLSTVRRRMVDIGTRSEIPYEQLCDELRSKGTSPPEIRAIFGLTADHASERFANLTLTFQDWHKERMPWGFSFSLDERSEDDNCAVTFDAGLYDPVGVHAFVSRYSRLLDAISRRPDLSLQELLAQSARTAAQSSHPAPPSRRV
jgi:amino acid adenylation domain-containing protein